MKRVATTVAIILAIITLLLISWQLRRIVLLFIISLALAATARAPLDFLMKRGIPRAYATAIVYMVGIVGLLGFIYGLSLPLASELEQISRDAAALYRRIETTWHTNNSLVSTLAAHLPTPEQFATFMTGGDKTNIAQTALHFTGTLLENISEFLIALILSMYWITDELRFERLWLSLLPGEQRARARNAWRALEDGVGSYIRSEVFQSLLAGAILVVGYWLLRVHYPFLWSLIVALAWLIPLVGSLIALVPLWLIASLNVGPLIATSAVIFTALVLAVMEFFVETRLYTRDRYGKVLVLLVMLALVDAFGFIGLLVAPIVATAIQIILNEIFAPSTLLVSEVRTVPATPAAAKATSLNVAALRTRLDEVRTLSTRMDDAAAAPINNMTQRLEGLLEKAENIGESA